MTDLGSPPKSPGSGYGFYAPTDKSSPPSPVSGSQYPSQSPFEVIPLGHVYLSPPSSSSAGSNSPQSRHLALHGNFLYEYLSTSIHSSPVPLGFAHLEKCKVMDIDDISFNLIVYRRPSKRADLHSIVIKCPDTMRCSSIKRHILRASALKISDLYVLDSEDLNEGDLGRGRFSCVKSSSRMGAAPEAPRVALKIVDKKAFWSRVETGKERKDTLVREVRERE